MSKNGTRARTGQNNCFPNFQNRPLILFNIMCFNHFTDEKSVVPFFKTYNRSFSLFMTFEGKYVIWGCLNSKILFTSLKCIEFHSRFHGR